MMADAPGYDYGKKDEGKSKEKKITGVNLKSKLEKLAGWDFNQIK